MNLIGDALHNFIDGVIITASYLVSINTGLATTIAIYFMRFLRKSETLEY